MKSKNTIILLGSISLLLSCKSVGVIRDVELGNSKYAILQFDALDKYPLFTNARPAELTKQEIKEIETIIYPKISQTIKTWNRDISNDINFVRQYVAVFNEHGEKEVWVQFFCHAVDSRNLRNSRLDIADGGNCCFSMKVNLARK